MNRLLILVLCVAFSSIFAFAQGGKDASYNDMLGKLKGGDLTIDFKALRFAYADQTPTESRTADPKLQVQTVNLLKEKKFKDVIKLTEAIQKTNYVDMSSHMIAALAYEGMPDLKKSKFHEAIYVGLVNSVLKDCDGNSPKTAYHVISVAEEYVVLNALELKRGTQVVETVDGHNYHVQTANDKATNEVVKVYFNIDKIGPTLTAVPKT